MQLWQSEASSPISCDWISSYFHSAQCLLGTKGGALWSNRPVTMRDTSTRALWRLLVFLWSEIYFWGSIFWVFVPLVPYRCSSIRVYLAWVLAQLLVSYRWCGITVHLTWAVTGDGHQEFSSWSSLVEWEVWACFLDANSLLRVCYLHSTCTTCAANPNCFFGNRSGDSCALSLLVATIPGSFRFSG